MKQIKMINYLITAQDKYSIINQLLSRINDQEPITYINSTSPEILLNLSTTINQNLNYERFINLNQIIEYIDNIVNTNHTIIIEDLYQYANVNTSDELRINQTNYLLNKLIQQLYQFNVYIIDSKRIGFIELLVDNIEISRR